MNNQSKTRGRPPIQQAGTNPSLRWRLAQWFEIRWWMRYLAPRQPQAYLTWKRSYWHSVMSRLSQRPFGRLLDAGAGPAGIFTVLHGQEIDAIDPLMDQYETLLPHFSQSSYPQVKFFPIKIETWQTHKRYDFIFCMNALNHVEDINTSFQNLYEHLAPKGRLILTIDAHRSTLVKQVFRTIPGDLLHPHQLTLDDYLYFFYCRNMQVHAPTLLKPGTIFNHYLIEAQK